MPVDQQSVLPNVRGIPWWGAVLVAAIFTAVGAVIDANQNDSLGSVFNFFYLVGCVLAVLAVRRRALFTAVAQPPLIAFGVGVITLYGLNADDASGLKSLIFKVLLPIANDFPWILVTFLVTLALGVGRWYTTRGQAETESPTTKRRAPRSAASRAPRKASSKTSTAQRSAPKDGAAAHGSATRNADRKGSAAGSATKSGATGARPSRATKSQSDKPTRSRRAPAPADEPRTRRAPADDKGRERPTRERPARDHRGDMPEGTTTDRSSRRDDAPQRSREAADPRRERPARDDAARQHPPRNAATQDPRRRATAGQVQRTAAGERLDGHTTVHASAAADLDRYEPATRSAGSAVYQTTRARNQR